MSIQYNEKSFFSYEISQSSQKLGQFTKNIYKITFSNHKRQSWLVFGNFPVRIFKTTSEFFMTFVLKTAFIPKFLAIITRDCPHKSLQWLDQIDWTWIINIQDLFSSFSMPGSLQILISSFLVFSSFWLHDFLYFKFPFCLSCLPH